MGAPGNHARYHVWRKSLAGLALGDGAQVTAKFLSFGTVYGFHSEIMGKYFKGPLRFLFLSCPGDVEKVEIRKHFRVNCLVPATVAAPGGSFQSMISDIGLGGMRFVHHFKEPSPRRSRTGTSSWCGASCWA